MMAGSESTVTIAEAIAQVLVDVEGPISTDEFYAQVLSIRPSSAKNPKRSIRAHIQYNELGRTVVFLDRKTLVPLRVAMRGVRFRIPLARSEVERGVLVLEPALRGFVSPRDWEFIQWLDEQGQALPAAPTSLRQQVSSSTGESFSYDLPAIDLRGWMQARRARRGDHILVTIEGWEPRSFRLELEPHKVRRRHGQEIARQNQALADTLFGMLESARNEQISVSEAIVTVYARLSDPRGYPGDHWLEVIAQDPRMKASEFSITYPGNYSPLERLTMDLRGGRGERAAQAGRFSKEQGEQVYRFKASFKYRAGLWRRIEIQGKSTLAEFDSILRAAFEHDWGDHMGGFWRLVRRGEGKRFREVDLGSVDPLGGGDGADVVIAGLGLRPGERLKYVYDFGDWIEHNVELETIEPPEPEVTYPRIIARNRPRHRYCVRCKARGEKTVATWICVDCSSEEGRSVLLCKECLAAEHEDHYAEEIVY
jgi:hypothetical protein